MSFLLGLTTIKQFNSKFHVGIAAFSFLLGAVVIYGVDLATTRPPVVYGSLSDVQSVAVRNGAIDLLFKNVQINRSCPAEFSVWLWRQQLDPDGVTRPVVYRIDNNSGMLSSLFPGDYHLISTLPRSVAPGEYNILAARRDTCSWWRWADQRPRQTNGGMVRIEESATAPKPPPVAVPLPEPSEPHNYTPAQ